MLYTYMKCRGALPPRFRLAALAAGNFLSDQVPACLSYKTYKTVMTRIYKTVKTRKINKTVVTRIPLRFRLAALAAAKFLSDHTTNT